MGRAAALRLQDAQKSDGHLAMTIRGVVPQAGVLALWIY